jgi:hypothetical protein
MRGTSIRVIAAVSAAESLNPRKNCIRCTRWHPLQADSRPATREGAKVHKIQFTAALAAHAAVISSISKPGEIPRHLIRWTIHLQRLKTCQGEDGVVQIRPPVSIHARAIYQLPPEKILHQLSSIADYSRRQPRHLQHLQPQTHDWNFRRSRTENSIFVKRRSAIPIIAS